MDFSENEINEFKIEATELLDQAESSLLSLDKGTSFKSCYDAVFRVFHSLKGGAGMLGLSDLQSHMHSLENIFSGFREKETLTNDETGFFLSGVDAARKVLEGAPLQFDYNIISLSNKNTQNIKTTTPSQSKPELTQAVGTVYLVDDEPDILDGIVDILRDANLHCETFTNPLELLGKAKEKSPDVIITDINMPQMSGLELIKEVRKFNTDIPIIILSGFITTDSLMSAIQSGIFGAIEKPYTEAAVVNQTLSAMKQHQLFKLLRRSINLLMYQFSDLEDFLRSQGKQDIANTAKAELSQLIQTWKTYNSPRT